jgi:chorismate-pyruvate lyase
MRQAITVAQLHARLLQADSASEVVRELFGGPVQIRRLPCEPMALSPLQHAQLRPTQSEPAVHRRIALLADGTPVSEADIWYVPARLWPGMAETLRTTDTPFGFVVRPMQPRRRTLAARVCEAGEPFAIEHEAVLTTGDNGPIALVAERYWRMKEKSK